jgi:oligosaccharide repeat unit polymerase
MQGDRSVLFAIFVPIIFARSVDRSFSLRGILAYSSIGLFSLIILGRIRQYMAGFGHSDNLYSGNGWMMMLYESLNGIFISNGTLFPLISDPYSFNFEDRVLLFFSPLLNLVPSFVFHGVRPTPIPSLLFHEKYFSTISDQGFGFSVLSEGYMLGGYFGAFILSCILGFTMQYSYILSRNGVFFKWLYGWVAYNALWFLRSDSTVFAKSILLPSLLILFLIGVRKNISKAR